MPAPGSRLDEPAAQRAQPGSTELDETYRLRVDTLLTQVGDALIAARSLSPVERVEHVTQLLGLVHALRGIDRDLSSATPEWAYAQYAVERAI